MFCIWALALWENGSATLVSFPDHFRQFFLCGEKWFGNETSATQDMAFFYFSQIWFQLYTKAI